MYQKIRIWVCSRVSALVLPQPVTKRLLTIQIVEHWTNFDRLGMLQQLGAIGGAK